MNAFNLTIVFIAVGVMLAACLSGICSLILSYCRNKHSEQRHAGRAKSTLEHE